MLAQGARENDVDEILQKVARYTPNRRIATPEDVANLVLFLAGDSAQQINGAALSIDGGLSA